MLQKLRQLVLAFVSAAQFLLLLNMIIMPSMAVTLLCFILQCLSWIFHLPGTTLFTWTSFLSSLICLKSFRKQTADFANSQMNLNMHFTLTPLQLFLYLFFLNLPFLVSSQVYDRWSTYQELFSAIQDLCPLSCWEGASSCPSQQISNVGLLLIASWVLLIQLEKLDGDCLVVSENMLILFWALN